MLSLIFMKNPKIIILDEPFNSLDIKAINDLTDYLVSLKRQKTILIASHYFNKLESLVDKLFIMDEGIIVQEENLSSSNSDKTNINLDRSVSSFFKNYVY
jgi:ABC-type multidrug transport system ATPase subunit